VLNILKVIFSSLLESLSTPSTDGPVYEKVMDHAFNRIYEVLNVIAYGLTGVILMITGFVVAYFNLLGQYDRIGVFAIDAVSIGGLVLSFIGFGIVYNSSRKQLRFSFFKETRPVEQPTNNSSPIEHALAAILMDFVKERELDREIAKESKINQIQSSNQYRPEEDNIH
jgi:hypothetical protein